jgi:hypothetical protein
MSWFAPELASGKFTEDDVAYRVSQIANATFGHLNYVDLARDPTFQHFLGFALTAPDFFWARNISQVGQVMQGAAGGKGGREQAYSMAAAGACLFTGCAVVNSILNDGNPHLDKPLQIVWGNKSYTIRQELGDIVRLVGIPYQNGHFTWRPLFANWRSWSSGRESPMARFGMEAFSGVNYRGEPTTMADTIKDTLAGIVPIPLQGAIKPLVDQFPPSWRNFIAPRTTLNDPISPMERFVGSMGVNVSRYSPITSTYRMASEWKAQHADEYGFPAERGTFTPSKYTPLRYALDDGNYGQAAQEYKTLLDENKGNAYKVAQGLRESLQKSFTGGKPAVEQAFVASLPKEDQQTYQAAVERRHLLLQRFQDMRSQSPSLSAK